MKNYIPLESFTLSSRQKDFQVLLSADGQIVTWECFMDQLLTLVEQVNLVQGDSWSLHAHDHGLFLLGFLALVASRKEIHFPNITSEKWPGPGFSGPLLSDTIPGAKIKLSLSAVSRTGSRNLKAGSSPVFDTSGLRLVFHTSGSTGEPKQVEKKYAQVEAELKNLAMLWGDSFIGAAMYSTVSPQHFYGFLFSALFPFCTGAIIACQRIQYPEGLAVIDNKPSVLVTSPAFLKRLAEYPELEGRILPPRKVFSSGGFLPEPVAVKSRLCLGNEITEIYGSTETGGIGYRVSPGESLWTPFAGIKTNSGDDLTLSITSPYLPDSGAFKIEDRVEFAEDGTFKLLGRIDSVVKIEEKRVALNDVENRILQSGLVADVAVIALEDTRQYLAAAVVLSPTGLEKFRNESKIVMNRHFRKILRQYFEPAVIPRKWRYLEKLPRNSMGKIRHGDLHSLFKSEAKAIVTKPLVLEKHKEKDRLSYTLSFPENYLHFQGHFPEMKILPAVAQVDWVMKFAGEEFGLEQVIRNIPSVKFMEPIFPDARVLLTIEYRRQKHQLEFSYKNLKKDSFHSKGRIMLEESN